MAGAIAAVPQVGGMILMDGESRILRARRDPQDAKIAVDQLEPDSVARLIKELGKSPGKQGTYWGGIVRGEQTNDAFVNVRRSIQTAGVDSGLIAAGVTVGNLSLLLAKISGESDRVVYIRYGNDRILAHPLLALSGVVEEDGEVLPSLDLLGDPVLANIDKAEAPPLDDATLTEGTSFRQISVRGTRYFIFERTVRRFGAEAVTIGVHVPAANVDAPIRQLYVSGVVAIGMVVFALLIALMVSGLVTRPIRRISEAAIAIGQLRLTDVDNVSPSTIREINDLSGAFNRMLVGLRAFETYVPRKLVNRLIEHDRAEAIASESRNLTVMFTDIVGFTTMSEAMQAKEVAEFLNSHLTLLSECIEAEGGTVDKYIGDAVMAFWGAPEAIENDADRACTAALAMITAIATDNKKRHDTGDPPVRVRIGIHSGPLVVGNIGSPSRMNYTVVGDTVNTAQRLENLGREVDPEAEVIVLVSGPTRAALRGAFDLRPAGEFQVKGRHEPVQAYRLFGADA
jgi:adenylate cyclase